MLQGVSLSFLFIPLMALAMSRIQPDKMGNATSIFNLMRNIGGSVGIAIMTTFLARRYAGTSEPSGGEHNSGQRMRPSRMLQGLKANFFAHGADAATASRKAIAAIYGMVQQHAAMLAFVEAFWLMGVVFLMMLPFLPSAAIFQAGAKPKPVPTIRQQLVSVRTCSILSRKMRRQRVTRGRASLGFALTSPGSIFEGISFSFRDAVIRRFPVLE